MSGVWKCLLQVTVNLLDKAMADSGKHQFLIDGFPRNEENRAAFEKVFLFLEAELCVAWQESQAL